MAKSKEQKEQRGTRENQAGRCRNCGGARFQLAIVKRRLLRNCRTCGEVWNLDDGTLVRKGAERIGTGV